MCFNYRPILTIVISFVLILLILANFTLLAAAASEETTIFVSKPSLPLLSATPTVTSTLEATDSLNSNDYQLKIFTEVEMLDSLAKAQNSPTPDDEYIRMLAKEILIRFPDLEDRDDIYWDLVYREGTWYKPNKIFFDDFLKLSENVLNSAIDSPEASLEKVLRQNNFNVINRYEAPNLFGDDQSAEVWQVDHKSIYYEGGVLIGLHKDEQNIYRVHPIWDDWTIFSYRQGLSEVQLSDHNANDQLEITSIITAGERLFWRSELDLYEWQGAYPNGRFVNIAEAVDGVEGNYFDTIYTNVWSFEATEQSRGKSIQSVKTRETWTGEECHNYQLETRYKWINTRYYKITVDRLIPFDTTQPKHCSIGWASLALEDDKLTDDERVQAASLLKDALNDWPVKATEIWGPSAEDYFRWKLGIWYVQNNQIDVASTLLKQVRDLPAHTDIETLSEMAEIYLREYEATQNSNLACQAAHDVALLALIDAPEFYDEEAVQQALGITEPIWSQVFYALETKQLPNIFCTVERDYFQEQFSKLVEQTRSTNADELIAVIEATESITIQDLIQDDITGDGRSSWLALVYDKQYKEQQLWGLVEQAGFLTTTRISIPLLANSDQNKLNLHTVYLNKEIPHANVVKLNNNVVIFAMDTQSGSLQVRNLFSHSRAKSYKIDTNNSKVVLTIMLPDVPPSEITYIWDTQQAKFILQSLENKAERSQRFAQTKLAQQTLTMLEENLLDFNQSSHRDDVTGKLPSLEEIAGPNYVDGIDIHPYLRYLIGLTYELNGDETQAVEIYWRLWREYPNSPYTTLARSKLELVN